MKSIILGFMTLFLCSCSWFTSGNAAIDEARLNFAISTGVAAFVAEAPDKCPRAMEISRSIVSVLQADSQTPVDIIVDQLKLQIDWTKLNSHQTVLVLGLIGYVETELRANIERANLDGSRLITLARFAGLMNSNIIKSCNMYWTGSGYLPPASTVPINP